MPIIMGEPAPQIEEESFEELIEHLGKLLAEEYIALMKKNQHKEG